MGSVPIAKRVSRLRLPKSEIARAAKLHENTVARVLAAEPKARVATERKVDAVVTAEEVALRDHLLELHPLAKVQA